MIAEPFNSDWGVRPLTSAFFALTAGARTPVTLPHDQMLTHRRDSQTVEGATTGYFAGGDADYEKQFHVPEEWRSQRITLEFEGVYRDGRVFVNGALAAHRPDGYTRFFVPIDPYLRYGETNVLRVECSAAEDGRWYTGLGIHRPVTLHRGGLVHLDVEGPRFTTPSIDDELAVVEVGVVVHNESPNTADTKVEIELVAPDGTRAAAETVPLTIMPGRSASVTKRMFVSAPQRWNPDDPNLYTGAITLHHDDVPIDRCDDTFGIRRLQIDPIHGLRINGAPIKLRGACVHHDNGPLGAAAIGRAEHRRVELLRDAGFNALRSAHAPMSKAMLTACDRLGMLVMDEAFDTWTIRKSRFDHSRDFPTWWRADIESMISKDHNHPSVIFYSIGNEIFETGNRLSSSWGRDLALVTKELDPTRFTVNCINVLVSVLDQLLATFADSAADGGVNDMLGSMEEIVTMLWRSEDISTMTAEAFSQVDIAGYNYGDARYAVDPTEFPNRVSVGSETARQGIARNWQTIVAQPNVVGDFCWTGWDYLGEAGIGRYRDPDNPIDLSMTDALADYPYLAADAGDLDITGERRPCSYFREIVFGLRTAPYIAVHRPGRNVDDAVPNAFAWDGSEGHWTWNGDEGKPVRVDVYSDAEEAELAIDGRVIGAAPAGPDNGFRATFETNYAPGTLTATAIRAGAPAERSELVSAGPVTDLRLFAEQTCVHATDDDLVFVRVALVDDQGNIHPREIRRIRVDVEGPGVLAGLGNGNAQLDEPLVSDTRETHAGTVLAIVRPTGPGQIAVHASAERLPERTISVSVSPLPGDAEVLEAEASTPGPQPQAVGSHRS